MKKQFKGSEKQIKWAEDIRKIFEQVLDDLEEAVNNDKEEGKEHLRETTLKEIEQAREIVNNWENAGEIINKYKEISKEKDEVSRVYLLKNAIKHDLEVPITVRYFKEVEKKYNVF